MKFETLTAIFTIIAFTLTDETQDPAALRLLLSLATAAMLATITTALTEEHTVTKIIVLLSAAFSVGTLIDPDPTNLQLLLAFIACPIISVIAIKQGIKRDHQALVESKKADRS